MKRCDRSIKNCKTTWRLPDYRTSSKPCVTMLASNQKSFCASLRQLRRSLLTKRTNMER